MRLSMDHLTILRHLITELIVLLNLDNILKQLEIIQELFNLTVKTSTLYITEVYHMKD